VDGRTSSVRMSDVSSAFTRLRKGWRVGVSNLHVIIAPHPVGCEIEPPSGIMILVAVSPSLFRGATPYPRGRGVWPDDERGGTLLREEPVIVFSYVAEADLTTNALSEQYRTLSRMGRQANQGEIRVVIDGKYYGITEYVEE
jgi:hypothetical protein